MAEGVKDLVVLDSFAAAGPEDAVGVDVLLVQCPCGDRGEVPVPAAA